MTNVDVTKTYGIGYSDVLMQLLFSLSQPVQNPEQMLPEYHEMAEMDETVGTGLEFLCYSVVSKIQPFDHPDSRVKDLVRLCGERISGTLEESRRALLSSALTYGFGVEEFTLGAGDSQWFLSSLQLFDALTVRFLFEKAADNSLRIATIRQTAAGKEIDIPASKCLVFRHNAGTNPYGRSRLKRCWRWYSFKRAIPKFWAIALERFGMPMLVGKSSDPKALEEILKDAYSQAYASIYTDDSIEAVGQGMPAGLSGAYESAAEFCNKMIYRSLFLPSLLESGDGGGSYALGKIHWQMFNDACIWLAKELAEAEIERLWRPIIEWNLGPMESYGTLNVFNSQTPEEQEIMSRIFLNGVNAGMLVPEEGDADWMRERLGFPLSPEGGEADGWRAKLSRLEGTIADGQKSG